MRIILGALVFGLTLGGLPAIAQNIDFGDDSGDYANDGECDDRRFYGPGMATTLDWEQLARDATDCSLAYQSERVRIWNFEDSLAATRCEMIQWGDDESGFPFDGECDDPRFEGRAVDGVMVADDAGHDATDCRRACEFGLIGLRNY
ncbi:MAG: hypothetical protein AAFU80_05425 [Pseudomonadota bacterium]